MPLHKIDLECPIADSFRVRQVAGLFDLPLGASSRTAIAAELPDESETWRIGVITGPSGCGKSSLARSAYGARVYQPRDWPSDSAIVDGFGALPLRQIVSLLTSVGFSSPPAWVRPYRLLSEGEKFRCDLARALSLGGLLKKTASATDTAAPIVVVDEFTSVVDRQVARIGSMAVAKAIRSGQAPCRFVAVTCHDDVAPWLEADWVTRVDTGVCQRRRLRRPKLCLQVARCHRREWVRFARHHYLSGNLNEFARCYWALCEGCPAAFVALLPAIGRRGAWRVTRLVVPPDYQGAGIGGRLLDGVAHAYRVDGLQVGVTSSHPGLLAHCQHSANWRLVRVNKVGSRPAAGFRGHRGSLGRATASFAYVDAI